MRHMGPDNVLTISEACDTLGELVARLMVNEGRACAPLETVARIASQELFMCCQDVCVMFRVEELA